MTLNRIACPECGAGLKSSTGFTPGQAVSCPKCETEFTVEEHAETELSAVATGGQSKKKQSDTEPWSYKNSWLRYAVLGVLVVVLGALGYMLYDKRTKDRAQNNNSSNPDDDAVSTAEPRLVGPGPAGGFVPRPVAIGRPGGMAGGVGVPPKGKEQSKDSDAAAEIEPLRKQLIGKWESKTEVDNIIYTQTIEYRADGTFSARVTGKEMNVRDVSGEWKVEQPLREQETRNR